MLRWFVFVVVSLVSGSGIAQTICKGTVCGSTNALSHQHSAATGETATVGCPSVYVVDGDTIHCGRPRIRLLGIDAPEIERCPRYRVCAPGDGQASKRSLIHALGYGPVRYQPVAVDRFGRTIAVVWAGNINFSCWQLQQGQAIYKARWDNGGIIERACR